ncbi:hypothetical protein AX15_000623 [Amanita polypyramis BW_CC]|nr:hypothetical protein AX15_000623 [Amanita polypyramis BW_CC]
MSRHFTLLLAIACAALAVIARLLWNDVNTPSDNYTQDLVPTGDTTAVILNWSRLGNVIKIVSVLCEPRLERTISQIFIWNNSPQKVNHTTLADSKCPEARLRLFNSPSNLYFQARFFACEKSNTPYCFIQDDDYLIWPEIVLAMRSRISEASTSAIHLLPPREMLSSQLRTISAGSGIHTSFVWLGHGTIMRRAMAVEFISLLRYLNATEEIMKMADNYFTVLMNTVPETWFDQGVELGGGQPFTIGTEGDERNNRHIRKATQMLDSLLLHTMGEEGQFPFIASAEYTIPPPISRAPCLGKVCIFETSIALLPPEISARVSMAEEMLDKASTNLEVLSEDRKHNYLYHPPSHAVDGRNDTCFRSPTNASKGDWISLDLVNRPSPRPTAISMIVDEATESILLSSLIEVDVDGKGWVTLERKMTCETYKESTSVLLLCKISIGSVGRKYRLRLGQPMDRRWNVCEIWVA